MRTSDEHSTDYVPRTHHLSRLRGPARDDPAGLYGLWLGDRRPLRAVRLLRTVRRRPRGAAGLPRVAGQHPRAGEAHGGVVPDGPVAPDHRAGPPRSQRLRGTRADADPDEGAG